MTVDRINDMVDRKVIESLQKGLSISEIQSDLNLRIRNYKKSINDFDDIYNLEFSEISGARQRYGVTYIKQCEKRVKDLNWMLIRKSNFKRYTLPQLFKLIQFKEKLLKSEYLPL